MKWDYLWFLPVALVFPVANLVVFAIRFGGLSARLIRESLVFLPVGLVSALVLIVLLNKSASRRQKVSTIVGYIVAFPVAFVGALFSGLMLPPLLGTLIYGAVPLMVGMGIGFAVGRTRDRPLSAL